MDSEKPASTELSYGLAGRLYLSGSGWLLLQIPNDIGNGAFAALAELGVEQPKRSNGQYNAHISVMTADEVNSVGGPEAIKERGQSLHYTTGRVRTVKPLRWRGVSKVWFIECHSPELKQLRKSYGLTPLPNGNHQFHCTFAIKKTRQNATADAADRVGMSKTSEDDNWSLCSDCWRCEPHCGCSVSDRPALKLAQHFEKLQPSQLVLHHVAKLAAEKLPGVAMYFAPQVMLNGKVWSHLAIPNCEFGGESKWSKFARDVGPHTLVSDLPSFDTDYYEIGGYQLPETPGELYRQLSTGFVLGGGGVTSGVLSKLASFEETPWSNDLLRYELPEQAAAIFQGITPFLESMAPVNYHKFRQAIEDPFTRGMSSADRHLANAVIGVSQYMPGGSRAGWVSPEQLGNLAAGLGGNAERGRQAGEGLGGLMSMADSVRHEFQQSGDLGSHINSYVRSLWG